MNTQRIDLMNIYRIRQEYLSIWSCDNSFWDGFVIPFAKTNKKIFFILLTFLGDDEKFNETNEDIKVKVVECEKFFIARINTFYKMDKKLFHKLAYQFIWRVDPSSKYYLLSQLIEKLQMRKINPAIFSITTKKNDDFIAT